MKIKNRCSKLSLLITVLVCWGLFLFCVSHIAYADNSTIKQKLSELAVYVDKEPPFSFRNGSKIRLQEEIKRAILLVENNNIADAKIILRHFFVEINRGLTPAFGNMVRQRLLNIIDE